MRMWEFYGWRSNKLILGFWFLGWRNLQLGVNICLDGNIEIHIPFGFFIFGRTNAYSTAYRSRKGEEFYKKSGE